MENNNQNEGRKNNTFEEMLKYYFTYKIIGSMFSKPRQPQPYKKDKGISLTAFILCLSIFYLVFIR